MKSTVARAAAPHGGGQLRSKIPALCIQAAGRTQHFRLVSAQHSTAQQSTAKHSTGKRSSLCHMRSRHTWLLVAIGVLALCGDALFRFRAGPGQGQAIQPLMHVSCSWIVPKLILNNLYDKNGCICCSISRL